MQEESLQRFLISVRCERFLDYLDPIGETAGEALARRIRWARMTRNDPAHADEAMFLLQHEEALRDVLARETDPGFAESVDAGQENGDSSWSGENETTDLSAVPEEPEITEDEGPSGIMTLEDLAAESEGPTATPAPDRLEMPLPFDTDEHEPDAKDFTTETITGALEAAASPESAPVNDGNKEVHRSAPAGSGGHVGLLQPRGLVRTASPPGPRVNSPTLSAISPTGSQRASTPTILPTEESVEEAVTPVPGVRSTPPGLVSATAPTPLMPSPHRIAPPPAKPAEAGVGLGVFAVLGVGAVLLGCVVVALWAPWNTGSRTPVAASGPVPTLPAPVVPTKPHAVPEPTVAMVLPTPVPAVPAPAPVVPIRPVPAPLVPSPIAVAPLRPAEPVAPVAVPAPAPAPAPVPEAPAPEELLAAGGPDLMGLWGGSVGDLPLLLRIQSQNGGSFAGKAEILEGSGRWSRHSVAGSLDASSGKVRFSDAGGEVVFGGSLQGTELTGELTQDGEAATVSVTR